jgi:hypothetical protein
LGFGVWGLGFGVWVWGFEPRVIIAVGQLRQLHRGANLAELVCLLRVAAHLLAVELKHHKTVFGRVEMGHDVGDDDVVRVDVSVWGVRGSEVCVGEGGAT